MTSMATGTTSSGRAWSDGDRSTRPFPGPKCTASGLFGDFGDGFEGQPGGQGREAKDLGALRENHDRAAEELRLWTHRELEAIDPQRVAREQDGPHGRSFLMAGGRTAVGGGHDHPHV